MGNQTVTQKIDNEYKDWSVGEYYLIEAGTGKGKSHFVKNTLYEYAKVNGKKILLLSNRINLKNQNDAELVGKEDIITTMNYQKLENNTDVEITQYDYIVCDECHYFATDSQFNYLTDVSFDKIVATGNHSVKIFMSATPTIIKYHMRRLQIKPKVYPLEPDYSYINQLYFYKNDELIEDVIIKQRMTDDEKMIYFSTQDKLLYDLHKRHENSLFNCAKDNNNSFYESVQKDKIQDMLANEKFEEQILFTTTCMDNGVNIKDRAIKHIVIDVNDIDSIVQCLGRKRVCSMDDTVTVYIKNRSVKSMTKTIEHKESKMKYAEMLRLLGQTEFVSQFGRESYKYGAMIYEQVHSGQIVKCINKLMYIKCEVDIMVYNGIKDMKCKNQYATFMSNKFGVGYTILDDEVDALSLQEYLSLIVDKRLGKDEQGALIDRIDYRFDRRQIRSNSKLSAELIKNGINYVIVSDRVKVKGKLETVWIVKNL